MHAVSLCVKPGRLCLTSGCVKEAGGISNFLPLDLLPASSTWPHLPWKSRISILFPEHHVELAISKLFFTRSRLLPDQLYSNAVTATHQQHGTH